MIKRVKPLKPKPIETPQCCVSFDTKPFNQYYLKRRKERCKELGYEWNCCTRPSSYEISEKFYCTMHAGKVALAMLLKES